MATFDEFYASLDPDAGIRGKQFEKFVKWFLKNSPVWKTRVEKIWLWDDYPDRWGPDCGIDLVFKESNGREWAVQSKCISPELEIPKKQIDSFLSESNDSRFYGRLLIATTDGIGRNALQVISRQEKQVVCFLLNQFRQSLIEFPNSPDDFSSGHQKDLRTPRLHQEEAIKSVVNGLKNAERGQLLMACGTGKTLTSLWIKEELKAEKTLILLPSLSLLSQTLREWSTAATKPFEWICVCSDKSVTKGDQTEDDLITNLSEIGVPVSNNSKEICKFLEGGGSKIVFSTYQSSALVAESQSQENAPEFDIVFADEAHRCAGKVSDSFGCVLDSKKIKSRKRLFLTATPRVLSKKLKKNAFEKDIKVASMDDSLVFGDVLYQLKFSDAIERELLSDYQVVIVGVDDEMIRNQIINRDLLEISDNGLVTDAETLASHIALLKAIDDYDLQRVITFHGRVKGAKKFAEDFPRVNQWISDLNKSKREIFSAHVSGDMSTSDRNKRINQLKNLCNNERGVLTNARCLSEGVDVPTLDGIVFIDPRQSQVDIIQAVGRAIRKSQNKTFGTIVIPVYIPKFVENINDQILESKFSHIWKIILALKSQDDSLMEEIDSLRISLGMRSNGGGNGTGLVKVIFDLPTKISSNFVDKIQTLLIQNASDDWLENFGKLKEFKLKNGHTNVQSRESSLGKWVSHQRAAFKKNRLSFERIKLLESINFNWDPFDLVWRDRYEKLKEYKIKNGHPSPPRSYSLLGGWTQSQRRLFKSGNLSDERVKLLDDLNFVWERFDVEWQKNFDELKNTGNPCPASRDSDLGKWVSHQRAIYKNGKLSKERITLLEGIKGWIWDVKDAEWQRNFDEFRKSGNPTPSSRDSTLGLWVRNQRGIYKNGKLSKERIALLEGVKGWVWDVLDIEWQRNFSQLKNCEDPNFPTKTYLKSWIFNQRRSFKNGKLSLERIKLLESISFVWDVKDALWRERLQELKKYSLENGHANPPRSYTSLGAWVNTQRIKFRKGVLSKERIQLLEDIRFWDWKSFK